jgi:hypothetical protein
VEYASDFNLIVINLHLLHCFCMRCFLLVDGIPISLTVNNFV